MSINEKFILPYDIRGKFGSEISTEDTFKIASKFAGLCNDEIVLVGCDSRPCSNEMVKFVCQAIEKSGKKVIFLGILPAPAIYLAALGNFFNSTSAIIVTASHLAFEFAGIKFICDGKSLVKKDLQLMMQIHVENTIETATTHQINLKERNYVIDKYRKKSFSQTTLNVAVDALHGSIAEILKDEQVLKLNFGIMNDPTFKPDAIIAENVLKFKNFIVENQCDVGFAFDSDADRLVVFDEFGERISSDVISLCLAKKTCNVKDQILIDVKTSNILIKNFPNGQFGKCGHANFRNKMKAENIKFGCEASGHYYFNENGTVLDDALNAAHLICEIISEEKIKASELKKTNNEISLGETRIAGRFNFDEIEKFKNIAIDKGYDIIEIDGVRAQKNQQWCLIRNANSEPYISFKMAASCDSTFAQVKKDFQELLLKYDQSLFKNQ